MRETRETRAGSVPATHCSKTKTCTPIHRPLAAREKGHRRVQPGVCCLHQAVIVSNNYTLGNSAVTQKLPPPPLPPPHIAQSPAHSLKGGHFLWERPRGSFSPQGLRGSCRLEKKSGGPARCSRAPRIGREAGRVSTVHLTASGKQVPASSRLRAFGRMLES